MPKIVERSSDGPNTPWRSPYARPPPVSKKTKRAPRPVASVSLPSAAAESPQSRPGTQSAAERDLAHLTNTLSRLTPDKTYRQSRRKLRIVAAMQPYESPAPLLSRASNEGVREGGAKEETLRSRPQLRLRLRSPPPASALASLSYDPTTQSYSPAPAHAPVRPPIPVPTPLRAPPIHRPKLTPAITFTRSRSSTPSSSLSSSDASPMTGGTVTGGWRVVNNKVSHRESSPPLERLHFGPSYSYLPPGPSYHPHTNATNGEQVYYHLAPGHTPMMAQGGQGGQRGGGPIVQMMEMGEGERAWTVVHERRIVECR